MRRLLGASSMIVVGTAPDRRTVLAINANLHVSRSGSYLPGQGRRWWASADVGDSSQIFSARGPLSQPIREAARVPWRSDLSSGFLPWTSTSQPLLQSSVSASCSVPPFQQGTGKQVPRGRRFLHWGLEAVRRHVAKELRKCCASQRRELPPFLDEFVDPHTESNGQEVAPASAPTSRCDSPVIVAIPVMVIGIAATALALQCGLTGSSTMKKAAN